MTLDQLISLYRKEEVQRPDMSLQVVKESLGQAYAKVTPMRGSERNAGDQTEARADYVFAIHYRNDLQNDDVIVWNGHEYNIRFIATTGQGNVYLTLEAERGVAV